MADKFYLRSLEKCSCGKAATCEVMSNRNASYGKFCGGCGGRKLRELEKTYKDIPASEMPKS